MSDIPKLYAIGFGALEVKDLKHGRIYDEGK
jgi:hypothetical protein